MAIQSGQQHNFHRDELASMKLRRLFEQRGFRRVRVGKFEEYSLYIENKNFLQSEQMITFMDMDGRLLALKPDMTLSVVKNIPSGPLSVFQKMYYLDEVYRVSAESRQYKAVHQIGVELVGPKDDFSGLEVVDLALCGLEAIAVEENYILDISHMGFMSGLLDQLGLPTGIEKRILQAIHSKSLHEIGALMDTAKAEEHDKNRVITLAELHGDIMSCLPVAQSLVLNTEMATAYDELEMVAQALGYNGFQKHLNLDFSVVNDLDYYNGLFFRGYVEGLPQAVLNGGRYDNLMQRMGKQCGAIGFAISLDELKIHTRTGKRFDFDLLVRYGADSDWSALLRCVRELEAQGTSVRLEQMEADLSQADFRCERVARFEGNRLIREGEWQD